MHYKHLAHHRVSPVETMSQAETYVSPRSPHSRPLQSIEPPLFPRLKIYVCRQIFSHPDSRVSQLG
jgi:hypothetical protein